MISKHILNRGLRFFAVLILTLCATLTLTADTSTVTATTEDRYFVVTAYYSPLPGQDMYFTGSYEGDLILNGNGTHAADGTPVYPGMLAAPANYPFGTQIYLEGLGWGTVHDRGGAIVQAGERTNAYDRVDVWMGHGDEGLRAAMQWGRRTVNGAVSWSGGQPISIAYSVPATSANTETTYKQHSNALIYGSKGENVEQLQEKLHALGYLSVPATGYFGEQTEEAVIAMQMDAKIIDSPQSYGSGYVGPQTLSALNASMLRLDEQTLEYGDRGDRVTKLQKDLRSVGMYNGPVTGFYGVQTEQAVGAFQIAYKVLGDESSPFYGVAGNRTLDVLKLVLQNAQQSERLRAVEEQVEAHAKNLEFGRITGQELLLMPQYQDLFDGIELY